MALGSDALIAMLGTVKTNYPTLSWGDLIVLAGTTAIEDLTGFGVPFCGGRVDAADGTASMGIVTPTCGTGCNQLAFFFESTLRMGLTSQQAVVLLSVPQAGSLVVGTTYFNMVVGTGNSGLSPNAIAIRGDSGLLAIAQGYSAPANAASFQTDFTAAWQQVMNADFFIGWNGLTCPMTVAGMTPTPAPGTSSSAFNVAPHGVAVLLAMLWCVL